MPTGVALEERLQIAQEVCDLIMQGRSLSDIFVTDRQTVANRPLKSTFAKWRAQEPEIQRMYLDALRQRYLFAPLEMLEIADDPTLDPRDKHVRIQVRQWIAERLQRELYGAKVDVEHSGSINVSIVRFADSPVNAPAK